MVGTVKLPNPLTPPIAEVTFASTSIVSLLYVVASSVPASPADGLAPVSA
jgi:hypothetical protein